MGEAEILRLSHRLNEAVGVILFPLVEAVSLLVQIAVKVERRTVNVSAFDRPFQEAPEIFERVRVDVVSHVALTVVNDLVNEVGMIFPEPFLVRGLIGENLRQRLDIFDDARLQLTRGASFPIHHFNSNLGAFIVAL